MEKVAFELGLAEEGFQEASKRDEPKKLIDMSAFQSVKHMKG